MSIWYRLFVTETARRETENLQVKKLLRAEGIKARKFLLSFFIN